MPWIQISLNTSDTQAEPLSDSLMDNGAVSVTFQDTHDDPVFEPLPGETPLWRNTNVIGLFKTDIEITKVLTALKKHPAFTPSLPYKIEQVEDREWVREWMDNFRPMPFGQRLWICPSWCEVPHPEAVNVILDPGLAFGTGSHPTTALCLQWLDSLDLTGKTLIDFGCGSGILAIAAVKLGAAQVIGIDIDPQAILASRDNARRNQVSQHLTLYLAKEQPPSLTADVVIANILAEPLQELAPMMGQLVKPGGKLGLSGILSSQAHKVVHAYQPQFMLEAIVEQQEWCRITAIHR